MKELSDNGYSCFRHFLTVKLFNTLSFNAISLSNFLKAVFAMRIFFSYILNTRIILISYNLIINLYQTERIFPNSYKRNPYFIYVYEIQTNLTDLCDSQLHNKTFGRVVYSNKYGNNVVSHLFLLCHFYFY